MRMPASERDFDVVTLDRVKYIEVTPDYDIWKNYARKKGIHAAVLSYLDARQENFYKIETTVEGKRFVTARGWEDLSDIIKALGCLIANSLYNLVAYFRGISNSATLQLRIMIFI